MSEHRPYLEELIAHLGRDHGCVRSQDLVRELEAAEQARVMTEPRIAPVSGQVEIVVDFGLVIADNITAFEALHIQHDHGAATSMVPTSLHIGDLGGN